MISPGRLSWSAQRLLSGAALQPLGLVGEGRVVGAIGHARRGTLATEMEFGRQRVAHGPLAGAVAQREDGGGTAARSEERRVGKECR